jgi:hypothetical protein
MSARAEYLEWRHGPAVGCVFARLIANRPGDFGQKVEEIPSGGTPMRVAGTIARRIDRFVSDDAISAAALLMPGISTLEKLTQVAVALRAHPRWLVTFTALEDSRAGDLAAVHISREIPFGAALCPSEALVLGSYPEFPPTRRSPVTALEVYVGAPMPQDPKTHKPTTKANLAHMDLSQGADLDQPQIDMMWQASIDARLKSLGVEDSRAKAKVSFIISASLAKQLGCEP